MSIAQPTTCKIENCTRLGLLKNGTRYFTKGYCRSHYRKYRLGIPLDKPTHKDIDKIIIEGKIAKITLGVNNGVSIIDAKDVNKVSEYNFIKDRNGYALSNTKNGRVLMHHLIIGRPPEGMYIDHINRDRLDNRSSNLRIVTVRQNNLNRKPNKNGKSQYKGVMFIRNRWHSSIYDNGVVYRKSHETEIDAAREYDRLAKKLFGEYAYLNNV